MASYTITIKDLCSQGYHFNLDNYPIFDENYRKILNQKIINHYWFREIGQETPDRFNWMLAVKMDEIMPYYNQLYASQLIDFDPLESDKFAESNKRYNIVSNETIKNTKNNRDTNTIGNESSKGATNGTTGDNRNETETIKSQSTTTNDLTAKTNTSDTGNSSTSSSGSKNSVFSDIPQAGITTTVTQNPDGTITTESTGYATTTTNDTTRDTTTVDTTNSGDATTTNTGTVDVEGESTRTIQSGTNGTTNSNISNDSIRSSYTSDTNTTNDTSLSKTGSDEETKIYYSGRRGYAPAQLLKLYRETLINIDLMIIEELENLFMGVYNYD